MYVFLLHMFSVHSHIVLVDLYLECRLWTNFVFHQICHTFPISQDICAKSKDEHAYVHFRLCGCWDFFDILFDYYFFQCFCLSADRKILEFVC